MPVRTKIEISPALVRRVSGLDDLARILFPDNRNHAKTFVAIWLEIKYADRQFLASATNLTSRYNLSSRSLEIVRAKMKKLGMIRRISHLDPAFGHRSGWTFSPRIGSALRGLAEHLRAAKTRLHETNEQKDRASLQFV